MKIELSVINLNTPIDKYSYSMEGFYHNDKELVIENKLSKITNLISMTSSWEKTTINNIENGFIVSLKLGETFQTFNFTNSKQPDNFMSFIHEVKRLTLEEK